jgi:prophage regulatory protein
MTNSNQLLRIKEVSDFTSIGKSTINLWVAQGKFPKPISLSPTIKVWRVQQLLEWIEQQSNTAPKDNSEESTQIQFASS